jgi:membrane protein DedA with SNARE-associated domain
LNRKQSFLNFLGLPFLVNPMKNYESENFGNTNIIRSNIFLTVEAAILNSILAQIEAIIDNPLVLFGLLFIIAAINLFFPPTPLETVTLFAGYLSAGKFWTPFVIIGATAGGMFFSSLILYQLIQNYGTALIEKAPLNRLISFSLYRRAMHWFKHYGLYMIYLGKLVPGMTLYTVLCCGLLDLGHGKVLGSILLSNLFFFFALVMVGRQLGVHWGDALPWVKQIGLISLALIVIFTLLALLTYIIKFKKNT